MSSEKESKVSASAEPAASNDNATTQSKDPNRIDYDLIEKGLGILAYMSPEAPGFSAVVKARFSDFLVHEVGLDGRVARFTSRVLPEESKAMKEEPNDNKKITPTNGPERVASSLEDEQPQLKAQLEKLIGNGSVAEQTMSMLEAHNKGQKCEDKFVSLPLLEKPQRKAVHQWIRESLTCARADTHEGQVRVWHVQFEKEMPNYKTFGNNKRGNQDGSPHGNRNKRQKKSWPNDRPEFLQFVLYKENTDTTTATKELSRKGSKARIGFAGMKDKRGITTQFCTMYKTEPEQILGDGRHATGGGGNTKKGGYSVVQVGNFEYVSKEMRLGTLKGNRFDLVLRNVQTGHMTTTETSSQESGQEILKKAADSMKSTGFINYFGTQRFGKYHNTHHVGIAVLQGNFRKAIDIIMEPKPDERPDAAKGRSDWQSRFQNGETAENEASCAKRVIKCLNRFMTAENSAMQSLSRFPQDYKRAFTCIPKTLRMMFLHAVQSLIWNQAASHRVALSKTDVRVGDLVQKDPGSSTVHVVSEEDVAGKTFKIQDVVLPLVGTKSQFPTNELGDLMKKLFDDIGVTVDMFKAVKDKDLALNGDYRKVFCHPADFDYEIKEYFDPLQPLLETDLMKLNGQKIEISPSEEGQSKKLAMVVGFTLPPSSYATVALRELMKKPTSSEYQKDLKLS